MLHSHLHWLRPFWGLALLPLLLFSLLLWRRFTAASAWQSVCDAHLLPHLLDNTGRSHKLSALLLTISWLLAVIALAGPSWLKASSPLYQQRASFVIALDVSSQQLADDVAPSRLARAKFKIADLLKRSRSDEVGLVAFTEQAFIASPLSEDSNTIHGLLQQLAPNMMPLDGVNLTRALQQSADLIIGAGRSPASILLVTSAAPTQSALQLAKQLHQQGIETDVLAINAGGEENQANNEALSRLAAAGGGVFQTFSRDDSDINRLMTVIKQQHHQAKSSARGQQWQDVGRWLVLLLLPLALLLFRPEIREQVCG